MLPWNLEELRQSLNATSNETDFPEPPVFEVQAGGRPIKLKIWLHRNQRTQILISLRGESHRLLGSEPFELSIRAPVEQDWGWVGHWLRLVPSGLQLYARDPATAPGRFQLDALEAALPDRLHALMTDPPSPLFESLKFHQGTFSFWPFSIRTEALVPQVTACIERALRIVEGFEQR